MLICFFETLDIILKPIVAIGTVVNTFILIGRAFPKSKKDKFQIQVEDEYLNLTFFNNGDYPIRLLGAQVVAFKNRVLEALADIPLPKSSDKSDEGILINDKSKRFIQVNYNTNYELGDEFKKYKVVYLCFSIKSDSGRGYEHAAYKLIDKKQRFLLKKCKLENDVANFED